MKLEEYNVELLRAWINYRIMGDTILIIIPFGFFLILFSHLSSAQCTICFISIIAGLFSMYASSTYAGAIICNKKMEIKIAHVLSKIFNIVNIMGVLLNFFLIVVNK